MTSPRFADPTTEEESSDRCILSGAPSAKELGSADISGRLGTGRAALRKCVVVNKNGRPTRMAVMDVISNRLLESSMKGDLKAIQFVVQSDQEATAAETANQGEAEEFCLPDKESLRLIAERLRHLTEEGEWNGRAAHSGFASPARARPDRARAH